MPTFLVAIRDLPIDWVKFGIGALLLLLPLPLLFGRGVQYRELDRTWSRFVGPVFALPWHWIDLVRSFGATWLLAKAVGLGWVVSLDHPLPKRALALVAVVFCVAVFVQTIACKFPDSYHAAFAPIIGIVAAVLPPIVAGLALISAVLVALGFRSAVAFFGALSVAVAVFGALFYRAWPVVAIIAAVSILPLLFPMLFHRDLVIAHRRLGSET
ncbi:MAG: hypothetical protein Q7S40_34690 [Opitutaceae bacterium]|nr:hypothetical protein [Opitutaceae bacterium]